MQDSASTEFCDSEGYALDEAVVVLLDLQALGSQKLLHLFIPLTKLEDSFLKLGDLL